MIVILDIKAVEVNGTATPAVGHVIGSDPIERVEVSTEAIYGRKYPNANGEMVSLGFNAKVNNILSIPYGYMRDLERENRRLRMKLAPKQKSKLSWRYRLESLMLRWFSSLFSRILTLKGLPK